MDRRPLVVGNWKMNGSTVFARELARAVAKGASAVSATEIAVCPPHTLLATVADELDSTEVGVGAQTVSEFAHGAYTGETSAAMLRDAGCQYAIVGHSERRHLFGETSDVVAAKAKTAVAAGLIAIICVGETLEERQAGATTAVISGQLNPILETEAVTALLGASVIAYEPVWAIGTGETATPDQAESIHAFIRETIAKVDGTAAAAIRILYGGSVKPDNAADLFRMADVDGGLIGGASLKAEDFLTICGSAPRD